METNTKRITKAQRFEDILALIHGETVKYGTTIEDAEQFIAHEVELLSRKNSSETRKLTDTQKANEKYRALICEFLALADGGKTCTEIARGVNELSEFNNQKVAALMRQLVETGAVTKTTVKGKSLFVLSR